MSELKTLLANRLAGSTNRPMIAESCNAKLTAVSIINSKKGNYAIRADFEQVSKAKQTLSVFFRTSDATLIDGQRKKMNYLLGLHGVVPPVIDTPITIITDEKGEPVLLDGEKKREDLKEDLEAMNEKYGTKQYLRIMDGEKRYRVLAAVDTPNVENYLKVYIEKLKECVGKTIFLEITGKDDNGYLTTAFRGAKTA